jgi:hypothetical protein
MQNNICPHNMLNIICVWVQGDYLAAAHGILNTDVKNSLTKSFLQNEDKMERHVGFNSRTVSAPLISIIIKLSPLVL